MVIQVALKNKTKESATILPADPKYLALSENFGESDMQLTGSSPEMLVKLVNSGLLPKDARIATRKDLELVLKRVEGVLREKHVDLALNLDSRDDKYTINHACAIALAEDLKSVGIDLGSAKLIPYDILTKKFRLSEKGKDTAKKLILNTADFEWDFEPSNSGLFGACLDRVGDWYARREGFRRSDSDCMVVVISGEASSQKFLDMYASRFKKDRDKAISSANEHYQKAVVSLRVE